MIWGNSTKSAGQVILLLLTFKPFHFVFLQKLLKSGVDHWERGRSSLFQEHTRFDQRYMFFFRKSLFIPSSSPYHCWGIFLLLSPSNGCALTAGLPGHPMTTLLEAVLRVLESLVARTGWAGNELLSYSRALRAHKVSHITTFAPLPSFTPQPPCASVSLIRTEDLPLSWGVITLSCSLPAFLSTIPLGRWDSAGVSQMLKSHDFVPPSRYNYSLLPLPPEGTENCLNLILACLV